MWWRYVTWRANPAGFSQLLYRLLEKVVPRAVLKRVKQILTYHGALECDGIAIPGHKAYGYRLTEPFRKDVHPVVCTDGKLNRRIWKVYARAERDLLPVHLWLISQVRELLAVDLDGARAFVATLKATPEARWEGMTDDEYRQSLLAPLLALSDGGVLYHSVDKYGRWHYPLTNLSNDLLRFVSARGPEAGFGKTRSPTTAGEPPPPPPTQNPEGTEKGTHHPTHDTTNPPTQPSTRIINGKKLQLVDFQPDTNTNIWEIRNSPLVWWDLKNCQPLFLALIVGWWHRSRKYRSRREELAAAKFAPAKDPYRLHALRGLAWVDSPDVPEDAVEFFRLTQAGTIYEALMTDEERAKGKPFRSAFKRSFMAYLCQELTVPEFWRRVVARRLYQRFPSVAKVVRTIKFPNYKQLAYLLQNAEATFFIGTVCRRIRAECPETPLFPKHDCLGTTPQHESYVRGVIMEEFARLGVVPQLGREEHV